MGQAGPAGRSRPGGQERWGPAAGMPQWSPTRKNRNAQFQRVGSARDWLKVSPMSVLLWKGLLFSAEFWPPSHCGSESLLLFLSSSSFGPTSLCPASSCFPSLPLLIKYLSVSDSLLFLTHTTRVWFYCLFFFPSQQNVSRHVVMEASVLDPTNASAKKAILVLSVNKWTETSAEWPGQVFLIRSLTWHLICWI